MPTFNPKSEARGRGLRALFCAIVVTVTSKTAIAETIVLVIARDYIYGFEFTYVRTPGAHRPGERANKMGA
jgi:hypothetical protein